MTIREFHDRYRARMSNLQIFAGEYLEASGLIFGVNFGVENAVDEATSLYWQRFSENMREELHLPDLCDRNMELRKIYEEWT